MSASDDENDVFIYAIALDGTKVHNDTAMIEGTLTLRDYFAGQYIAGRASREGGIEDWEESARDAYGLADAMLKERAK